MIVAWYNGDSDVSKEQLQWTQTEDPRGRFSSMRAYGVDNFRVGDWSTKVLINGSWYNSVHFEFYNRQGESIKVSDFEKYQNS